MEGDRTRPAHATHSPTQSCPQMDSRWQTKERETKENLEKNSREGNEGAGMDLGLPGKTFCKTDLSGGLLWRPYAQPRAKRTNKLTKVNHSPPNRVKVEVTSDPYYYPPSILMNHAVKQALAC